MVAVVVEPKLIGWVRLVSWHAWLWWWWAKPLEWMLGVGLGG